MALTYNKQVRSLDLKGVITLSSGTQISLTTDDILSYSVNESSGSEGLPLGSAESASFSLTISNVGKNYTPSMFDNAEVHMEVGIQNDSSVTYSAFGVWYVADVSAPEQSVSIDLSGNDALNTLFEATWSDSKSAYPTTLGSLATTICTAAGVRLASASFTNASVQVASLPEWGEETTLRSVIGFIAACAGGFACMTKDGKLEIISYSTPSSYSITSDYYTSLTRTNGAAFKFNALEVSDDSSDDESYTRYAIDTSITDNATNTIRVESNPLFTAAIANSVKSLLSSLTATAASVGWIGDPAIKLGDKVTVTDTNGSSIVMRINAQSFSFSGGLSATLDCSLPTIASQNSSSYTSSGNVIDGNGNIRVTRIANFDKSVVSATSGHFENLSAAEASIDSLLSNIINAITLKASNIEASSVTTDALTTMLATILQATINKLDAKTITTDSLFANIAEILTLKAKQITAENAHTDSLTTEMLRVAGYATIDDLVADSVNTNSLIVKDTTATKTFIKTLQVLSAQLAHATVGELVVKASDGNYYKLDVNSSGGITPTQVTVTASEITAGVTSDGRSSIIETSLTADDLAAGNLKAINALIDHITADRLDVTTLFAKDAFVNALYTSQIYGGKSIKIMVGDTAAAAAAASKAQTTADNATSAASAAQTSANSAATAAANAQSTADSATTTANNAKSAADTATSTANTAKSTAESANTKATNAETTANTANTTANSAKTQADSAVSTANTANTTANAANTTANTAKDTADTAKSTADTAKTTADEAKALAFTASDTAPTSADEGYRWLDTGVTPQQMRTWRGLSKTPSGATMTTDRSIDETVEAASGATATFDNTNNTITSDITITATAEDDSTATATITVNGEPTTVTLTNGTGSMTVDAEAISYTITADADIDVSYTCSGWETVNDTTATEDKLDDAYEAAVAARTGVERLDNYIEITGNGLNVKSESESGNYVNVNNDGVDIYVNHEKTSSFISNGLVLGNYILWHPEESGGLAFNLLNK